MRLKIAIVAYRIGKTGGVERYTWEIAKFLAQQHDVTIISNLVDDTPDSDIKIKKIFAIRHPGFLSIFSFSINSWLYLWNKNFDIVHTQGAASFRQNVVTAHSVHKHWFFLSLGQTPKFSFAWLRKLANPIHYLTIFTEWIQYRKHNCQRIIAVSKSVKQELIECYGYNPANIDVIYNGVDIKSFTQQNRQSHRQELLAKLGIPTETLLLLFVAHEFRRKGLSYVLKAMAAHPQMHLLVVGRDDPTPFRSLITTLRLHDRIHFVGMTNKIEKYYNAADIFIFPTQYEPFGLAILEAMAFGLPIITTQSAGAAELLTHNKNALLLSRYDSISEIDDAINALKDESLRQRLGENALQIAEQLTWENQAKETLAAYVKIKKAP